MATIQDFINSLGLDRTAVGQGAKVVTDTAQKNKWNAGQFGSNVAQDAGTLAQFLTTLVNPLDRNNPLNIAITRPQDVGAESEKFLKNTAAGINKMAGEPVNPETGTLQMPSAEKIVQNAYEAPLSTALVAAPLKLPKVKGKVEAATDLPPIPKDQAPVRVNLDPKYNAAGKEKAVEKTIDREVSGKTADERYSNLEPAMERLGLQITDIMSKTPKNAKISDIMKDYDKNLNKEGIYRTTKAPKDVVQAEALGYMTDLYNSARGETSKVVPTEIPDYALYELKQSIGKDAASVYKKIDNGTSLTERDKVILVARQTVDDTLSQLHPEIKELSRKQSHLYDASDSLYKAREAEFKAKEAANNKDRSFMLAGTTVPNFIAKPTKDFIDRQTAKVSSSLPPTKDAGLPIVGGFTTGAQRVGAFNSVTDPETGAQITPQDQDISDKYTVSTPLDTGVLISEADFAQQQAEIEQQIGAAEVTDPILAKQLQGQLRANEREYDAQTNIRKVASDTKTLVSAANIASSNLRNADPGLLNVLSKGYDHLSKASNGQYAALAANLKILQDMSGVPLTTATTMDSLQRAIDEIVKQQQVDMQTAQSQYSGAGIQAVRPQMQQAPASDLPPIPQEPVNWQQNDPRVEAIMQGGNLPPIQ
jgi:hypothetical protein